MKFNFPLNWNTLVGESGNQRAALRGAGGHVTAAGALRHWHFITAQCSLYTFNLASRLARYGILSFANGVTSNNHRDAITQSLAAWPARAGRHNPRGLDATSFLACNNVRPCAAERETRYLYNRKALNAI